MRSSCGALVSVYGARAVTAWAVLCASASCGGPPGSMLSPPPVAPVVAPMARIAVVRLVAEEGRAPAADGAYLAALTATGAFEVAPGWAPDLTRADRLSLGAPETLGPLVEPARDAGAFVSSLRGQLRTAYDTMLKGNLKRAHEDISIVVDSVERSLESVAGDPLIWSIRIEAYALLGQLDTALARPSSKDRYAAAALGLPIGYDDWIGRTVAVTVLSPVMEAEIRSAREAALASRGRGRVVLRSDSGKGILVNGVLFAKDKVELNDLIVGQRYYVTAVPATAEPGKPVAAVRVLVAEPGEASFSLDAAARSAPSARAPVLVADGLALALTDLERGVSLRRALDVHGAEVLRATPEASAALFVVDVHLADGQASVSARGCTRATGCRDLTALVVRPRARAEDLLGLAGAIAGRALRALVEGNPAPDAAALARP